MSLMYGEFYEVSGYFLFPYKTDTIFALLQHFRQYGIVSELSFYKKKPSMLTYDNIMSGLLEEKKTEKLDFEDFCANSLIRAEISFSTGSFGRLSVNFWDAQSYGVMLLLCEEDIKAGIVKPSFLNDLAVAFFDILQPAFGHMALEEGVFGFESIKSGSGFLDVKNSYLCNELYQQLSAPTGGKTHVNDFPAVPLGNAGILLCPEKYRGTNFYDLIKDVI